MSTTAHDLKDLHIVRYEFDEENERLFTVHLSNGANCLCHGKRSRDPKKGDWFVPALRNIYARMGESSRLVSDEVIAQDIDKDVVDLRPVLSRTVRRAIRDARYVFDIVRADWLPKERWPTLREHLGRIMFLDPLRVGDGWSYCLNILSPQVARASSLSPTVSIPRFAERIGYGGNAAIQDALAKSGTQMSAIGSTLFVWLDSSLRGLPPEMVRIVTPDWDPAAISSNGQPFPTFEPPAEPFSTAIRSALKSESLREILKKASKPKVWVKDHEGPFTDSDGLDLAVGGLDFHMNKAIEHLYENPGHFQHLPGRADATLRELYEDRVFSLNDDLPNMLVPVCIVAMKDETGMSVLVTQRGRTGYEPGAFSPSCEEHFHPARDRHPHDTVRRCLWEEFGLSEERGEFELPDADIRLLGFLREWGSNWNVCLLYAVTLACEPAYVFEKWFAVPEDQKEHSGLLALSINKVDERVALLRAVRRGHALESDFEGCPRIGEIRFNDTSGEPKEWHSTLAMPRTLLGLLHWCPSEEERTTWLDQLGE